MKYEDTGEYQRDLAFVRMEFNFGNLAELQEAYLKLEGVLLEEREDYKKLEEEVERLEYRIHRARLALGE